MPKKKWEKPKLIVLVRGKPEERVLSACKIGAMNLEQAGVDGGCIYMSGVCTQCITSGTS